MPETRTGQLLARSIKITVVLNAAEVANALQPVAAVDARIPLAITVEGRKLRFDVAPKAIRKCLATIAEHGADHVALLVQGKLMPGDVVGEAGLVALAEPFSRLRRRVRSANCRLLVH